MLNISKRGTQAYNSPIRKLSKYAEVAEQKGKHIFYLNIGQPDIPTPAAALTKIREFDQSIIKYAPAEGLKSYRQKLTQYYHRMDINIEYEHLLVTTGASEAILFALLSCLDRGDEIIIPEPFYAIYNGFAEIAGVKICPVTSYIDSGFALPEITSLEAAITPKTKAIFICNPNNPTGCVYSKSQLQELASLVKRHQLFLFADEVYREFCYDGSQFISILNLKGLEKHAVVLDSISKRYSACGARIGALVTRNQEVLEAAVKFARFRLSPPVLGQILAEGTLEENHKYIDQVKNEYDLRRHVLYQRLNAMPGVTCYLPGGAFYCFAKLPIEDSEHFCQWLLEVFEYNGQTLMLAPGAGFYATPGLGKDEVRIAYVLNANALNKAMDCLEKALEIYPHRKKLVMTYAESF